MLYLTMKSTFPMNTHEGMRFLNFPEVICYDYTRHTAICTLADAKRSGYSSPVFAKLYSVVRNSYMNHLIAKGRCQ
jgi:hypothetical protein